MLCSSSKLWLSPIISSKSHILEIITQKSTKTNNRTLNPCLRLLKPSNHQKIKSSLIIGYFSIRRCWEVNRSGLLQIQHKKSILSFGLLLILSILPINALIVPWSWESQLLESILSLWMGRKYWIGLSLGRRWGRLDLVLSVAQTLWRLLFLIITMFRLLL